MLLIALFLTAFVPLVYFTNNQPSPASAADDVELFGYAWSSNVGWISFSAKNCDSNGDGKLDRICGGNGITTAGSYYGVKLRNNSLLVGKAWSSNIGYITFGPTSITSKTVAIGHPADSEVNWVYMSNERLYGWARACEIYVDPLACSGAEKTSPAVLGGWDGWIKMNNAVRKTEEERPTFEGYAWGGGDNDNISTNINNSPQFPGWISFDYVVAGGAFCGDGKIDSGETCGNCVSDVGVCIPPPAGDYCGNGACGAVENCMNCALDCEPCSLGGDLCPDGKTPLPNPIGVYQEPMALCPLFVGPCTVNVANPSNIGTSPVWSINPSGGEVAGNIYHIVWKNSTGGILKEGNGVSFYTYSLTSPPVGLYNPTVSVYVNGTEIKQENITCDQVRIADLSTISGLGLTLPKLYASFTTAVTATARTASGGVPSITLYPLGSSVACSSGTTFSISVTRADGTAVPSTSIQTASIQPLPAGASSFSPAINLVLTDKVWWLARTNEIFKVKIKSNGVGSCASDEYTTDLMLKNLGRGEYYEL